VGLSRQATGWVWWACVWSVVVRARVMGGRPVGIAAMQCEPLDMPVLRCNCYRGVG
jgi:hypothetical protein